MPLLSLRGVISALAALSIAVVAAITLSLTLISSLSALRDVGKSHSLGLLKSAEQQTETFFAKPQSAVRALQNMSRIKSWQWPSDNPATHEAFADAVVTLYAAADYDLSSIMLYFADNTHFYMSSRIRTQGPYLALHSQVPSSITAANGTANQTLSLRDQGWHAYNLSLIPEGTTLFDTVVARHDAVPNKFFGTEWWHTTVLFGTSGGRRNVNAGLFVAVQEYNNVAVAEYFFVFAGPMYTPDAPAFEGAHMFSLATSALSLGRVNDFLRATRATGQTAAFAVDRLGYLLGTSMDKSHTSFRTVDATASVPIGCDSTDRNGGAFNAAGRTLACRAHVQAYGYAPLETLYADRALMYADAPTVEIIRSDGAYYFAASLPVHMDFTGYAVQLVLLMPETDILAGVVRSRNVAIGVTCAVFVVVTVAIFVAIRVLLAPLDDVADRMLDAASFREHEEDDDATDHHISAMDEVARLQEAYYAMSVELQRVRAFVPQALLAASACMDDAGDDSETARADAQASTTDTASARSFRSRRSQQSRHSKRSGGSARGIVSSAVDGGAAGLGQLTQKTVAVLVANARGFAELFHDHSSIGRLSTIASSVDRLVQHVDDAVRAHGGVLGAFHGDHFTATFNAVRPCASFTRQAALAALDIAHHSPSAGPHVTSNALELTVGISSGTCAVGNVGSDSIKSFVAMGHAFTQAVVLERLTRHYGRACRVLATARVCMDVASTIRYQSVDLVRLPGRRSTVISALLGRIEAPVGQNDTAAHSAEWLYVFESSTSTNATLVNGAFEALRRCEREEVARALDELRRNEDSNTKTGDNDAPDDSHHPGAGNVDADLHSNFEPLARDLVSRTIPSHGRDREHPPVTDFGRFYDRWCGPSRAEQHR